MAILEDGQSHPDDMLLVRVHFVGDETYYEGKWAGLGRDGAGTLNSDTIADLLDGISPASTHGVPGRESSVQRVHLGSGDGSSRQHVTQTVCGVACNTVTGRPRLAIVGS